MTHLVHAQDESERGWLGVYSQNLTDELREGMNYNGKGVLINRVISDSPAADAGLEEGDVITAVGGRSVDSPEELADLIQARKPDSRVMIRVVRDGRTRNLNVRLGSRPQDEGNDFRWYRMESGDEHGKDQDRHLEGHVFRFNGDDIQIPDINIPEVITSMGRGRLGVRVETLNEDLAKYFQAPDGRGVLILEVMSDTPAEKAGRKAGDVILEVGGEKVYDSGDLVRELRSHDEGPVSLEIVRSGSSQTVEAELEGSPRAYRWRSGDGDYSFRFDDRMRDRIRSEIRRGRDEARDVRRSVRDELRELRQELRDLKRELKDLRDGG